MKLLSIWLHLPAVLMYVSFAEVIDKSLSYVIRFLS